MKNAAKERALSEAYFRDAARYPVLTKKEEHELVHAMHHGDDESREAAVAALVRANLRLVIKIAKEFRSPSSTLMDLIQAGNVGLVKGMRRYEPGKGACVSTYVAYWIRAEVLIHLRDSLRPYRVGTTDEGRKVLRRINRVEAMLLARDGEDGASDAAVAAEIGVSTEAVSYLRGSLAPIVSLHARREGNVTGTSEPTALLDLLPGDLPDPEDAVMDAESRMHAAKAIADAKLTEREQRILELHVLPDKEDRVSLTALGDEFGVCRERVRQLKERALGKVRRSLEELLTCQDFDATGA